MDGGGGDETVWLSTARAGRLLGMSAVAVYRLIDQGQLPAYRMGRVIRLRPCDVDAFIESCRIQPGEILTVAKPA